MKKSIMAFGAALLGISLALTACDTSGLFAKSYHVTFDDPSGEDTRDLILPVPKDEESVIIKESDIQIPVHNDWDFIGWFDDEGTEFKAGYKVTKSITIHAKWHVLPDYLCLTGLDAGRNIKLPFWSFGGYNGRDRLQKVYAKENDGEWQDITEAKGYSETSQFFEFTTPAVGDKVQYKLEIQCRYAANTLTTNVMTIETLSESEKGKLGYFYLIDGTCSAGRTTKAKHVGIVAGLDENRNPTFVVHHDNTEDIVYSNKTEEGKDPVGYDTDFTRTIPRTTMNDGEANLVALKKVSDIDVQGLYPMLEELLKYKTALNVEKEGYWYIPSRDEVMQIAVNINLINSQIGELTGVYNLGNKIPVKTGVKIASSTTVGTSMFSYMTAKDEGYYDLKRDDRKYTLVPVTKYDGE